MKHLKSFNQINESELWNIFNRQNKTYMDLDEEEYDYMMDDLSDMKGRHQITESDKQRILKILNGYLKPEVTGIELKDIALRVPHVLTLYYKTNCGINPDFRINFYNDDYFVIQVNVPVAFPKSISMVTLYYVIDGWDGFEEWVEKTTPYTQNQEMYKLLKSPLKDLRPTDYIEVPDGLLNNLMKNYPYIRGLLNRNFYFFDPSRGGEHFCKVEIRGTTKQREYYYDDGTLLDDGTRSRKPSNK
jgi:hypothetical protein